MKFDKLYIASLPRSGSTVLTALLDQRADILCLPESFFPALIDHLSKEEWSNRKLVAALFVASCSDGSPMSLEEAEACIVDDKEETLDRLAAAVAIKCGRNPATIRTVVWKFTRLVGSWKFAAETGGKFLLVQRNPLNVFESQSRVPFGKKNRSGIRFALFEASYKEAFRYYPADRTRNLPYPEIGARVDEIAEWIGSTNSKRTEGTGAVSVHAGKNPWHSEIQKPFENKDAKKLEQLPQHKIQAYRIASAWLKMLPFIPRMARIVADRRQATALRTQACKLLEENANPQKS
jgi:hypothetical protein